MNLQPIRVGDGLKVELGWLVLSEGMVRGIFVPDPEYRTLTMLAYAHDKRIQSRDIFSLSFDSMELIAEWLEHRLEPSDEMGIPTSGESGEYRSYFGIWAYTPSPL